jgi:hypothetical protein
MPFTLGLRNHQGTVAQEVNLVRHTVIPQDIPVIWLTQMHKGRADMRDTALPGPGDYRQNGKVQRDIRCMHQRHIGQVGCGLEIGTQRWQAGGQTSHTLQQRYRPAPRSGTLRDFEHEAPQQWIEERWPCQAPDGYAVHLDTVMRIDPIGNMAMTTGPEMLQIESIGGQDGHPVALTHQTFADFNKIACCATGCRPVDLNNM